MTDVLNLKVFKVTTPRPFSDDISRTFVLGEIQETTQKKKKRNKKKAKKQSGKNVLNQILGMKAEVQYNEALIRQDKGATRLAIAESDKLVDKAKFGHHRSDASTSSEGQGPTIEKAMDWVMERIDLVDVALEDHLVIFEQLCLEFEIDDKRK